MQAHTHQMLRSSLVCTHVRRSTVGNVPKTNLFKLTGRGESSDIGNRTFVQNVADSAETFLVAVIF